MERACISACSAGVKAARSDFDFRRLGFGVIGVGWVLGRSLLRRKGGSVWLTPGLRSVA